MNQAPGSRKITPLGADPAARNSASHSLLPHSLLQRPGRVLLLRLNAEIGRFKTAPTLHNRRSGSFIRVLVARSRPSLCKFFCFGCELTSPGPGC